MTSDDAQPRPSPLPTTGLVPESAGPPTDPASGDGAGDGRPGGGRGRLGAVLLRGSTWNLAAQLTPVVINLGLTPYLIHGLGIDQYGLYALAATITIFLSSFDGGIGGSAPRFFALYAGTDDRRATTRLLCTLALLIVVGGGALSVGDWYASPLLADLFRMPQRYRPESVFLLRTFGILVTVSLLHSLFVSLLQARQRFGYTSRATIASYLAWAAGLWLTVHGHHGLRGIALSLVGEQLVATVVILPGAWGYLDLRLAGLSPRSEVRRFFSYSARVQATSVAALLSIEFDALIIGAFLPVRDVGLYNAGANVSTQVRYVGTSVLPPLGNHLATSFGRGGEQEARVEMARLQRLWVITMSGWCAAALGATYFAVTAWLGPHFETSALVCLILLVGNSVNLLTGVMSAYAGAIGQPGVETRYGTVTILLNIVLTAPLVLLGVLGVVSATAAAFVIGSLYFLRVVHQRLSADLPSYLADVPVLRSGLCLAATVGLELLVAPHAPEGPLGMLVCALPALLTLAAYAVSCVGVRRAVRVLLSLRGGRPSLASLLD